MLRSAGEEVEVSLVIFVEETEAQEVVVLKLELDLP